MFFLRELTQDLIMHPSYFNPSLSAYLKLSLRRQVEGSCSGRLGYIIAVTADNLGAEGGEENDDDDDEDKGMRGRIAEDGQAVFRLRYQAIVYRPFRGEVVDGVVASVNKMGIFVDVGPLQCFVSTHLIPPDFSFDPNANPPCFTSNEDVLKIEKGTKIRLKIVGTRVDATEIFAIGTIKEDYLGPIG
ncbi:DNA-directed RNA polymerase II subunit RPB7 [Sporobolomyces salmoneus]|uniref:DNA-directed RNA polymerase II subunit RPB7 n=1 Tax=Sporobolomyces salmoneus TaxID=183962 RepID=UPI00316F59DA